MTTYPAQQAVAPTAVYAIVPAHVLPPFPPMTVGEGVWMIIGEGEELPFLSPFALAPLTRFIKAGEYSSILWNFSGKRA